MSLFESLLALGPSTWLFLLLVFLFAYLYLKDRSATRGGHLPPSPGWAWPVLGHIPMLKKNPLVQFADWRSALGDVFTLQLGCRTVVVVNGYENIVHTLVKQADCVSDRPTDPLTGISPVAHLGILTSSGPYWKEQRTTALHILREFGMGKNLLAEKISEEANALTDELSRLQGGPCSVRYLVNTCVSNVICSVIFGKRFELNDPELLSIIDNFDLQIRHRGQTNLARYLPWTRHLPGDLVGLKRMAATDLESQIFTSRLVAESLKESNESFCTSYMKEMEERERAGQSTYLDNDSMIQSIKHLFIAGTETTSTTILWSLLYLINHPSVQEKIFKEINEEVGLDRSPTMADKRQLKYLSATIMEVGRLSSIVALGVPHMTTGPMEVKGYVIPPECTIIANLHSVHMDEKIWGDPDNFRPERFIDKDGNLINREELIPFSQGRRICLGEALAKMELFLFLSSMLQRFQFLPEDPSDPPPIKMAGFGAVCSPEPFKVKWVKRKA